MTTWTVTYETAVIARGSAATKEEAERAAYLAHTLDVLRGMNPDALAYHVGR